MNNFNNILLFLFTIILLIILLFFAINILLVDDTPDEERYIDVDEIQTGDIFMVSYQNKIAKIQKAFTKSEWVHSGLVWKDEESGIVYILEGSNYRDKNYKGFFKMEFEKWFYKNRRNIISYLNIEFDNLTPIGLSYSPFIVLIRL